VIELSAGPRVPPGPPRDTGGILRLQRGIGMRAAPKAAAT
jgi:hypothetical protein